MLSIDGSYGEGGGQILRTAVSLSLITHTPIKITHIRENRPNPGIKSQHYTALSIMKLLCQATTEGLEIGSPTLSFTPDSIASGYFHFDVGTAGSMILVFQTCIPCALHIQTPIILTLKGGTDVKWSPSWDYFNFVFLPLLKRCGLQVEASLLKRGYYPKGGGEAVLTIHPCQTLNGIIFDEPVQYKTVEGRVHLGNLAQPIGIRMKHEVMKLLLKDSIQTDITIDSQLTLSSGAGITLWSANDKGMLGCSELGEKGVPAETVASTAVQIILHDILIGASLDEHLFDQILLYLVLAKGTSIFYVKTISSHAETTMWLIQQFFPNTPLFSLENHGSLIRVTIHGIGQKEH